LRYGYLEQRNSRPKRAHIGIFHLDLDVFENKTDFRFTFLNESTNWPDEETTSFDIFCKRKTISLYYLCIIGEHIQEAGIARVIESDCGIYTPFFPLFNLRKHSHRSVLVINEHVDAAD
jgi:hypothetical protein